MFEEEQFQQLCKSCPEILLYFTINELGGFIWRMNHDMADFRIAAEDHPAVSQDVTKAQVQIQFAVDQTTRFGVSMPRNTESSNGGATPEYWTWFQRWDDYVKSLTDEQFKELNSVMTAYSSSNDATELDKWHPEVPTQNT
jgi:hypothetical protein